MNSLTQKFIFGATFCYSLGSILQTLVTFNLLIEIALCLNCSLMMSVLIIMLVKTRLRVFVPFGWLALIWVLRCCWALLSFTSVDWHWFLRKLVGSPITKRESHFAEKSPSARCTHVSDGQSLYMQSIWIKILSGPWLQ